MITNEQINYYKDKGYLVVENAIPQDKLKELQKVTDEYVANSKDTVANDEVYDLADDHSPTNPNLRRLKNPHLLHDVYKNITEDACILDIVEKLVGKNIRRDHTKLNFKSARGGESIEWHQDWAFYPHTNDNLLAFGLMLEDVTIENGPLQVIPGSHKGPVLSHHNNGVFCGAVDPDDPNFNREKITTLTGRAGCMTIHHARTLHGSAPNKSDRPRLILFYEIARSDAWPILGASSYFHGLGQDGFWEDLQDRMIIGQPCVEPCVENVPVRMPLPPAPNSSSIFQTQKSGGAKSVFT